jgi:hypothetical protein
MAGLAPRGTGLVVSGRPGLAALRADQCGQKESVIALSHNVDLME